MEIVHPATAFRCRRIMAALLVLSMTSLWFVGCGGQSQSSMMRHARRRTAEEKADEKDDATAIVQAPRQATAPPKPQQAPVAKANKPQIQPTAKVKPAAAKPPPAQASTPPKNSSKQTPTTPRKQFFNDDDDDDERPRQRKPIFFADSDEDEPKPAPPKANTNRPAQDENAATVTAVAIGNRGKLMAFGNSRGSVGLFDIGTATTQREHDVSNASIAAVGVSDDGAIVAAGDTRGHLKIMSTASVAGLDAYERQRAEAESDSPLFHAHTSSIHAIDFTADNNFFATGGQDGTVRVWRRMKSYTLAEAIAHLDIVTAMAVDTNDRWIVSGSRDGSVKAWDTRSGNAAYTLKGPATAVTAIAINDDSSQVVAGYRNGEIRVWDPAEPDSSQAMNAHTNAVTGLQFDSSMTIISSSADSMIKRWRLPFDPGLKISDQPLSSVPFALTHNRNGVAVIRNDNNIDLFLTKSGKRVAEIRAPGSKFTALAWSTDNTRIVTGDTRGEIAFWNTNTGQSDSSLPLHAASVRQIIADPQRDMFISGDANGAIKTWSIPRKPLQFAALGTRVNEVATSADGRLFAAALEDGSLRYWDLTTNGKAGTFPARDSDATTISFSSEGKYLVAGYQNGEILLWDFRNPGSGNVAIVDAHAAGVTGVAYDESGRRLLSSDLTGNLRVATFPKANVPETVYRGEKPTRRLIFASGEGVLAAIDDAGTLRYLSAELSSREISKEALGVAITSASCDHDTGLLAIATTDGKVLLRRLADQSSAGEFSFVNQRVSALSMSPRGDTVAVAQEDGVIRLHALDSSTAGDKAGDGSDTQQGRVLSRMTDVQDMHFSHDAATLYVATPQRISAIRVDTGAVKSTWPIPNGRAQQLVFDNGESTLAIACSDRNVRMIDTSTGKTLPSIRTESEIVGVQVQSGKLYVTSKEKITIYSLEGRKAVGTVGTPRGHLVASSVVGAGGYRSGDGRRQRHGDTNQPRRAAKGARRRCHSPCSLQQR